MYEERGMRSGWIEERGSIRVLTIKAILLEQYESLEEQVEEEKLLDLEWQIERAMNALRCPPANSDVFPYFNLIGSFVVDSIVGN